MADYKREIDGDSLHMYYPPEKKWLTDQSPDYLHVEIGKHATFIHAKGHLMGTVHFDTDRQRIERLISMLQDALEHVDKMEDQKTQELERELEERKKKKRD